MPQALKQTPETSGTTKSIFIVSLVVLGLSVGTTGMFMSMNSKVQMVVAKVINTHESTAFSGRKQTVQQEILDVSYTVDGKEYRASTPAPQRVFGKKSVNTFYYPAFPSMAWFWKKQSNLAVPYCLLAVFLAGFVAVLSGVRLLNKAKAAAAALAKVAPRKGAAKAVVK